MIEPSSRCRECAGPLVHDQRYCLRCGARRGPLPARIGLTIGEILERGRARPQTGADLSAPPAAPQPHREDTLVPAARSAAVAILLMIAFGCVVGSMTTPGGVESLARALVVAVKPPPPAPTPTTSSSLDTAASGGSRGSGGSGASTAASSPAPAAAPAAVPQQTVTVGNPTSPTGSTTPTTTTPANLLGLPPIKHVWEIVLSEQGYNQTFASSTGHPYLATRLRRQGKLITGYYGVAQSPLANEIALLSGQGPTPQTIAGCSTFADIAPATVARFAQVKGTGCLYPSTALTLPDQLHAAGLTWRAYVQGIGEPAAAPATGETTTTTTTTDPATSTTDPATSTTTATSSSSAPAGEVLPAPSRLTGPTTI